LATPSLFASPTTPTAARVPTTCGAAFETTPHTDNATTPMPNGIRFTLILFHSREVHEMQVAHKAA
jgi:hypothetical protein